MDIQEDASAANGTSVVGKVADGVPELASSSTIGMLDDDDTTSHYNNSHTTIGGSEDHDYLNEEAGEGGEGDEDTNTNNTAAEAAGSVVEDVIAEHRALHQFMVSLLEEVSVSSLQTFLIQDNAVILKKSASQSAQAAIKRFWLGDKHHCLITKEISRWESYPFEVEQPKIAESRSSRKAAKKNNGCVPQRKTRGEGQEGGRRRSGFESAGEIKADIVKKAASLPRPPRRRSSVHTEDSPKATMQDELLMLFEEEAEERRNSNNSTSTSSSNHNHNHNGQQSQSQQKPTKPRREVSPHRWMTPKKPIRRVSELPEDLMMVPPGSRNNSNHSSTSNNTNPRSGGGAGIMMGANLADWIMEDSSVASTESTVSEVAARQSDLSSVSESSEIMSWTTQPTSSLGPGDAAIIEEDDDDDHVYDHQKQQQQQQRGRRHRPGGPPPHHATTRGADPPLVRKNSIETVPRKPVRRVSEAIIPDASLPPLSRVHTIELSDNDGGDFLDDNDDEEEEDDDNSIAKEPAAGCHPSFASAAATTNDNSSSSTSVVNAGGGGGGGGRTRRVPQKSLSAPLTATARLIHNNGESKSSCSSASPRKPTRRPSEIPEDLLHQKNISRINSSSSLCDVIVEDEEEGP